MVDDIVSAFHWFRDALYQLLKVYQGFTEPVLGDQSYWVAIVMLTLTIRILLIPLVAKQVRSQRAMAELGPELKKLQAKHKDDRQKLNQEMMALYQERGVNPMAGCLPLLVQAPFFLALYHVIFQREIAGEANILLNHGFFGIPLDTVWWQLDGWGQKLFTLQGIVILLLILAQACVMFVSMRQMMAKQAATMAGNAQAQQMQQTMMKVMPLMLGVVGVNFPLAVLIYWVTTNLWQWGQQSVMLRTHPIATVGGPADVVEPDGKSGGGKSGGESKAPARSGGLFANFRAQLTEASQSATQQRNGKNGTQPKSGAKPAEGERRDGNSTTATAAGSEDGSASDTPRRRSSAGGRKTTSSSRSGGGKGGAGSRQRRRKR